MDYKIKYPKIKDFDKETNIPTYITIINDYGKIKITYSEAEKYIKECEDYNKSYIRLDGEFGYININIDDIIEAFKPQYGFVYKIKDKFSRNSAKIFMGIGFGILLVRDFRKSRTVLGLEEELEAAKKLANDPSNAGRVLRSQRKS